MKGDSFKNAVAKVANTRNKSEEAIRSNHRKAAGTAYNLKLIEMRYFQENFTEKDFRRFDRLRRLSKQKQRKKTCAFMHLDYDLGHALDERSDSRSAYFVQ